MSAVAIGAGVSAAAGIAGAAMSGSAAGASSKKQMQMSKAQMELAQRRYQEYQDRLQPYLKAGRQQIAPWQQGMQAYEQAIPGYFDQVGRYNSAVDDYRNQGLGGVNGAVDQYQNAIPEMTRRFSDADYRASPLYTPMVNNLAELQATPGYQFQLQQGQKALAQQAAARGGLLSGAQTQAANNFAQQTAATGFQAAWERAQAAYGRAFDTFQRGQKQQSDVLGQNVNNNMNRANAYAQGAGLAGQGAGLYGAGMGLMGNAVNQRMQGVGMGVDAVNGMGRMGLASTGLENTAMGNYADAYGMGQEGRAGAIIGGVRQGLQGLGGIYNAGANQGWWGDYGGLDEIGRYGTPGVLYPGASL